MKKLFLLLATGLIATASNAQQAEMSVVFKPGVQAKPAQHLSAAKHLKNPKTTAGSVTSGWFDYVDTVLGNYITTSGASGDELQVSTFYMWTDSTAIFGYNDAGTPGAIGYSIPSFGYDYNVSTGLGLDPFSSVWPTAAANRPNVTPTNAYVIDSIAIVGTYGRPASATYTDHLNISLLYGNGSETSNMPLEYFNESSIITAYGITAPDSILSFPMAHWDTVANEADTIGPAGTPAAITFQEPLTNSDTNVANLGVYSYALPGTGLSVPAGNFAMASVSFVSGATTYTIGAGDSITSASPSGGYYYGSFQPAVGYNYNATSTDVEFPPYRGSGVNAVTPLTADYTTGYFKTIGYNDYYYGWSAWYQPNWEYSNGSTGGGYYLQMPYIMFHVSCPTCTTINATPAVKNVETQVKAYPNPATNVVNIAFLLATPSDVTVSLTNMVGQVVITQKENGVSNGNFQFSTSALPDGMYFYSLNANGEVKTGRVVVAH